MTQEDTNAEIYDRMRQETDREVNLENELFEAGNFVLHSGGRTGVKVVCDNLDWGAVAAFVMEVCDLPPFEIAVGIPKGGLGLAIAMDKYAKPSSEGLLICADVLTTGTSMEQERQKILEISSWRKEEIFGLVAFARGPLPDWVHALWIHPNNAQS